MEIIGHRGAKGLAKENSIESFKQALSFGVDAIETDVRLKNKELVLSHDSTLISEDYEKLETLLKYVDGKVPINLEIKEERAVLPLKKLLKNYSGKIVFSSFDYKILAKIRNNFPNHELAVLEKWSGIGAVAKASLLDTDRIHIKQNWLWGNFVRSLNHKGYRLYAYTVNDKERADELEKWGVKGIFTDYPDRFSKV